MQTNTELTKLLHVQSNIYMYFKQYCTVTTILF